MDRATEDHQGSHSKQSSLLSFYEYSNKQGEKEANRPPKKTPARPKLHGERAERAEIAEETLKRLPELLSQLHPKVPAGYLYSEVQSTPGNAESSGSKTRPKFALDRRYCPNLKGNVHVVEGDTFDTAIQFDQLFPHKRTDNTQPVCVLNMASDKRAGGGWRNGALAQEEDLCYRSSLIISLKKRHYPLKSLDAIYSPKVVVFRKSSTYEWLDTAKPESLPIVSAISMAAVRKPQRVRGENHLEYKNPTDRDLMKDKMRMILRVAAFNKHRRLVLGAFGCGAFYNPREEVANCWSEVLKEEEFQGWWQSIAFGILKSSISSEERSSLEVFKDALDGLTL